MAVYGTQGRRRVTRQQHPAKPGMELRVLLCVLASLQSLPRPVSPAGPLPAPTITVDPQLPLYVPGGRLTLRCSAPQGLAVSSYQFYNQRGERVFSESDGPSMGPWLVLTAAPGKTGAYSCDYWAVRDGKNLYSSRSQPVQVQVMDFPLAPALSAISDPPGRSPVTLVCSAPQGFAPARYRFLRQGTVIASQPGARLKLNGATPGPYTCMYEVDVSGTTILSLQSISLSVQQPGPSVLPETFRPTLRLSPPGPRFTTRESVTLTCSAPSWEKTMKFCFLKAGEKVTCTGLALRDSQSYQMSRLSLADSGSYTCMYWVAEHGQEIPSPESQPRSFTVTDVLLPPPAPQIILDPPKHIYVQGERVSLTCSAPGGEEVRGYRFYEQRGERISELDEGTSLEHTAETGQTAVYTCAYWIVRSEQAIMSEKSKSLSILVTVPLLVPTLALHPQLTVYLPGEKVSLTCSAPHGEAVVGFRFHQHRRDQILAERPAASGTARMELTVQAGNNGAYTCQSWRWEAGQEVVSENSNSIIVPVSDRPPQPALSMDPPSGAVSEGFPLLLTCTAPGDTGERRFHFYQDGAQVLPGDAGFQINPSVPDPGSVNVSVLSIPQAHPNHTGGFTCGYEENIRGRWILSSRSRVVNIMVNATRSDGRRGWDLPLPLVAGCGAGGAALVLLVLLGCCCRKKKKALQQRSHERWDQPGAYNHRRLPSIPGRKSKRRGKGAENVSSRAGCKSVGTEMAFQQRGEKLVSGEVVYSEPLF